MGRYVITSKVGGLVLALQYAVFVLFLWRLMFSIQSTKVMLNENRLTVNAIPCYFMHNFYQLTWNLKFNLWCRSGRLIMNFIEIRKKAGPKQVIPEYHRPAIQIFRQNLMRI